jgi:hypothetical protein
VKRHVSWHGNTSGGGVYLKARQSLAKRASALRVLTFGERFQSFRNGWSANFTQPRYVKVARDSGTKPQQTTNRKRSSALTRNVDTTQKTAEMSGKSKDHGGQEFQR